MASAGRRQRRAGEVGGSSSCRHRGGAEFKRRGDHRAEGYSEIFRLRSRSQDAGVRRLIASFAYMGTETLKPVAEFKDHSDAIWRRLLARWKLLASASADHREIVGRGHRQADSRSVIDRLGLRPCLASDVSLACPGSTEPAVWEVNAEAGKLVLSAFAHTQPVTKIAARRTESSSTRSGKNLKKWDASKLVEARLPPQMERCFPSP